MSTASITPATLISLPDDIICELFFALAKVDVPRRASTQNSPRLFDDFAEDRHPSLGWIRLTHVARRLRHIGIDLPTLWGRVVSIFPSARETTFARSRNAPLDLYLGQNGFNAYSHWPIATDALLARARYIQDVVHPDARGWWVDTSLPCLEILQIEIKDTVLNESLALGQVIAPTLTSYGIYGGFIPFHAPSLQRLVVGHKVVWTTLVDSLRTCPFLEMLVITDTREPSEPAPAAAEPVELMHLTTFRLTIPSSMSALKLIECLSVPASTRPEIKNCTSLILFRNVVQRDTLSGYNALSISIERTGDAFSFHRVEANVSKRAHTTFDAYRVRPSTGITTIHSYFSYDHALPHLLGGGFTPEAACRFDTLVFYSNLGASNALLPPLSASGSALANIGSKLRAFSGITTLYVQRESAQLLLAIRDTIEKSVDEMPYPSLKTIILDVFTSHLDASLWDGIIDLLLYRKGYRCPLERLVIMGSHLCHLSPDASDGSEALKTIDLRPVEGLVGEIVDLREGEACTCGAV
ncbi:unnamed protein product [Peniophora sp. CBMAI 1063]|nr:unnamed protein product [Peniophora sp. CBMAI 1063]